jgi:hypothetical protein
MLVQVIPAHANQTLHFQQHADEEEDQVVYHRTCVFCKADEWQLDVAAARAKLAEESPLLRSKAERHQRFADAKNHVIQSHPMLCSSSRKARDVTLSS